MHTYKAAVEVDDLAVSYGSVTALDGLHLRVEALVTGPALRSPAWLAVLLLVFVPLAVRAFRRA